VDGLTQSVQSDYLKYERAADAFARFCKVDIATTPKAMIGEEALSAYIDSASRSRANTRRRVWTYALAGALALPASYLAVHPQLSILAIPPALTAGILLGRTKRIGLRTDEPRLETLIAEVSQDHRNNILNLDEFCRRAASGRFGIVQRHPNGSIHPFNNDLLKCFSADGGKLLVLSDAPEDWWRAIRRKPVPRGEILIDVRSAVASGLLTSETLIKMDNEEAFEAKHTWLLERARSDDKTSKSFRLLLNLIKAFRRPDIKALGTLKEKEDILEKEGFSRTVIHRMHSGNYEPFQSFLKTLPLHELP